MAPLSPMQLFHVTSVEHLIERSEKIETDHDMNHSTSEAHFVRTDMSDVDPRLLGTSLITSEVVRQRATIQVTVYVSSGTQRTWFVPRTLLIQHSIRFQTACKDPFTTSITLQHDSLAAFQDFIDFVHSNIYSSNKNASNYHCIGTHLEAWALGEKLEAGTYQIAALRKLYARIEPLARAASGSIADSPVRVEDIEFVSESMQRGDVIRAMMFDAVAAHCTQADAIAMADALVTPSRETFEREAAPSRYSQPQSSSGPRAQWAIKLTTHDSLYKRILISQSITDRNRSRLLRPIEEYIHGKVIPKKETFRQQSRPEQTSSLLTRSESPERRLPREDTQIDGRHMRSPGRRRGSSASSTSPERIRLGFEEPQPSNEDDYMTEDGHFFRPS